MQGLVPVCWTIVLPPCKVSSCFAAFDVFVRMCAQVTKVFIRLLLILLRFLLQVQQANFIKKQHATEF